MSANLLRQVLYARGFFLSSIYRAILQSVGFLPAELHIILAKVLSPFGSRDLLLQSRNDFTLIHVLSARIVTDVWCLGSATPPYLF